MRNTQVLDRVEVEQLDTQEVHDVCCVGCKIDGFIAELKSSSIQSDKDLGRRFSNELERYNREQEALKNPRKYKPC